MSHWHSRAYLSTPRSTTTPRLATCRRGLAAAVMALALAAPLASALAAEPAGDDKTAQAKALSQEANAMYAVGDFAQAADRYQAAYKLKPDPALLYNAAQSYRMAGNNEKALLLYKNYAMFYPNARNRNNVDLQISKLQEAIAAQHKAQTQPPTTTEPTTGNTTGVPAWGGLPTAPTGPTTGETAGGAAATTSSSSSTQTSPSSSGGTTVATALNPAASSASASAPGATLTQTAPAPSEDTPIYKKWWLWTIVGVAAGGAVAVVLLSRGSSQAWNTAPDFGPGAGSTR